VSVTFTVDGREVSVADDGASLLEVLRDVLGLRSAKDGCSPQGQCGCCTVLVDGSPRVACVTPARRVSGRVVTTLEGLAEPDRSAWAEAFCSTGASQCGFCTPGIVMRLEGLRAKGVAADDRAAVDRALAAHLCRCTGWNTIVDAYAARFDPVPSAGGRDLYAAGKRAELEGGVPQVVGPQVALGEAGFADDTAPADALVAVPDGAGGWAVADTLHEARAAAGKVQGRRSTVAPGHPVALPPGPWAVTLQTTWVEPAYLETDASWCEPGGRPVTPLANGGAFGAKLTSPVTAAARELADRHGRTVRVLLSREDVVRLGPKRPPMGVGMARDGTGVMRVARTPGIEAAVAEQAPGLVVQQVDVAGPATSVALRAAGWAEAAVVLAGARGTTGPVRSPSGGEAEADITREGGVRVRVACGDPLDEIVLRSYCLGATHMAVGWVTSEGLAVDGDGTVQDLTVRSFGVLGAADTPPIEVEIDPRPGPPVNGSDAVFAAVAAAVWRHQGCPPAWPTGVPLR